MAYLTIDGNTVPVSLNQVNLKRVNHGKTERAYDQTLRSTEQEEKREWEVATTLLTDAEIDAALGTPLPRIAAVNGDMVRNVAVNCFIKRTQERETIDFTELGAVVKRVVVLSIQEV